MGRRSAGVALSHGFESRLESKRLDAAGPFSRRSRASPARAIFFCSPRASCGETGNNGGVCGEIKTAYGLFIFRRRAESSLVALLR